MVLGWQAPAKTGGADIRGYYLDYRTVKDGVKSKWHEINLQAVTSTSYKVGHDTTVFLFYKMKNFDKVKNYDHNVHSAEDLFE